MLAVPFFCWVAANALPDLRPIPLRAEALNAISSPGLLKLPVLVATGAAGPNTEGYAATGTPL
ncbi:hypothetical protein LNO81_02110 [Klebsiella variicola subsp. variicola]|nr:hypothetical protein [Klebsiella variicola subsp. variicola]